MSDTKTYFIQSACGGPIKIGRTNGRIDARIAELQCGNPDKLLLIAHMPGDHEWRMHRSFREYRRCGEWFDASDALIAFLRSGDPVLHPINGANIRTENLDEQTQLLIDADGLGKKMGISGRKVFELMRYGRFPLPVRLGSNVRWRAVEIREWLARGCPPVNAWEKMKS